MSNYSEIDWDWFHKRVKEAKETHDTGFSLINHGLKEIPSEVFEIESLTSLDLRWNCLKTILPEISKLKNLDDLQMDSNQIETLRDSFGELINLEQFPRE
ncbi:MAG: hypothetical protein WBF90_24050 [Rivularia sp. (in: cyanobacteria)]|jgi:Leucine-rich repeat (LRR) protein